MSSKSSHTACVVICVVALVAVVSALAYSYSTCSRCGSVNCDCAPSLKSMRRGQLANYRQKMSSPSLREMRGYSEVQGPLRSPSLTVQPYGGQPPAFRMAEVKVPGDPLYSGYGGVNMNDLSFPQTDDQLNQYHSYDAAFSGLSLRQLPVQPTEYKTIIDNSPTLQYGVIRPAADKSYFQYMGTAQPYDNNPNRLIGVL